MQPDRAPLPGAADRASDIRALTTCAKRLLQAADGRGRRWPIQHCAQALAGPRTSPAVAQACAQAMAAVVAQVQRTALGGRG